MKTGELPHTEKKDTSLLISNVSSGRYLLVNMMISIWHDDGKVHFPIMKLLITFQTIIFAAALLTHSHGRYPAGLRGWNKVISLLVSVFADVLTLMPDHQTLTLNSKSSLAFKPDPSYNQKSQRTPWMLMTLCILESPGQMCVRTECSLLSCHGQALHSVCGRKTELI